jgi:enoyl-CoA hydratase/carnithine racemase
MGLVNRLVPAGRALETAIAWARELATRPAPALAAIKQSILHNRDRDVTAGSARDALLSAWIFETSDAREGHRAFVERRAPAFSHELPATPMPSFPTVPPTSRSPE